jgi:hypothetical protein
MEEAILPRHWLKIGVLMGPPERKLPNAIALGTGRPILD